MQAVAARGAARRRGHALHSEGERWAKHRGEWGDDVKTPDEIQQGYIDEFVSKGDAFEQFDYLLQVSAQLDELAEELKVDDVLVKGCQSQVWLYPSWESDEPGYGFAIKGDSDTLMVRGVIRIFQQMFAGQDARSIVDCPVRFVEETELMYVFDAQRQAGVSAIAKTIKDFAQQALV